jgi:hypothetical protein
MQVILNAGQQITFYHIEYLKYLLQDTISALCLCYFNNTEIGHKKV